MSLHLFWGYCFIYLTLECLFNLLREVGVCVCWGGYAYLEKVLLEIGEERGRGHKKKTYGR